MIYGSTDREFFLKLKKINKLSKNDNVGMLLLKDNTFDVYKMHYLSKQKFPPKNEKAISYYGINYTNISTFLEAEKSPPFFYENWIVAFSGEIANKKDLFGVFDRCEFLIYDNDSSLVNCILNHTQNGVHNEVNILKETFSLLYGSYSAWVFNLKTKNCFLLKCNSDLYANIYNNNFSSKEISGFDYLNDGEIYQLTKEGVTTVGYFNCDIY